MINMTPVKSSQIHSIGHDAATGTLAIRFNGRGNVPGSLYHYANFSADDFARLKAADSVGSHFYKHIKPHTDKFPYQRINEEKS
ncbi:KTSC domain-containing protein [Paramixta manurensis]|uniref:KTSC domain-containing protein n=1 Tax=Paramixta manurensis TaxID=2740817 RepID=A0A6M8UQK9_9GAMM|nr:KTSC domain-containing protein [Erwiniaceae bacterium PD-1]